ncbi:hypothetical protein BATDEDRAFT_23483 [Batrachochytrium dendrobatidis JAM81]|uniref:Uncharacterized protein n=1 Tax=Batrachochytrium dendrobatidis (strain JAM81 / FGSC 10211) TaxID=684364 RepID=F4NZ60_BATDJ|nr:uncharacterized protein BATDEDRAFT_23483 [Batrachochytrium dendrobatidis JAM81]EGF81830.1 hypothetical protein BATDEDRAFT_23483 [Batrachochytrium dendrobatidis JAM81]|eukprot:XP_006677295.1 hypothetical protein BATDEDRAFT_23483 [Batrachochytrium dendrobatidis JAM81]
MKLTADIVAAGSTAKRNKNELICTYLSRISHVSVVGRGIVDMSGISVSSNNLTVLFLYDNKIQVIQGLENCHNLTRLYLQNNNISSISGLETGLYKLSVLNISGNKIKIISGLHNLPNLQTLYVDKQILNKDEAVEFDLDTLAGLSELEILVERCKSLSSLQIANNLIRDRYLRQKLILANSMLRSIDGKDVTQTEHEFLCRMEAQRFTRSKLSTQPKQTLHEQLEEPQSHPIPHLPPYASQYR